MQVLGRPIHERLSHVRCRKPFTIDIACQLRYDLLTKQVAIFFRSQRTWVPNGGIVFETSRICGVYIGRAGFVREVGGV